VLINRYERSGNWLRLSHVSWQQRLRNERYELLCAHSAVQSQDISHTDAVGLIITEEFFKIGVQWLPWILVLQRTDALHDTNALNKYTMKNWYVFSSLLSRDVHWQQCNVRTITHSHQCLQNTMSKVNVDTNFHSVISLEFITFMGGLYKQNCAWQNYLLLWEATIIQATRMWRYTQQPPPTNIQGASNAVVSLGFI
jgi:hypothetical protein